MGAPSSPRRHPRNKALTWERLQRGWSSDELARQVKASMIEQGDGEMRAHRAHGSPVGVG